MLTTVNGIESPEIVCEGYQNMRTLMEGLEARIRTMRNSQMVRTLVNLVGLWWPEPLLTLDDGWMARIKTLVGLLMARTLLDGLLARVLLDSFLGRTLVCVLLAKTLLDGLLTKTLLAFVGQDKQSSHEKLRLRQQNLITQSMCKFTNVHYIFLFHFAP